MLAPFGEASIASCWRERMRNSERLRDRGEGQSGFCKKHCAARVAGSNELLRKWSESRALLGELSPRAGEFVSAAVHSPTVACSLVSQ